MSGNLAVPTPRTFTVGETEVGSYLNSLRDALNFLLNVPFAVLTQSATQTVTNATWTALTFDQSTVDSYGGHSNSTNNSRYVAQVAGWYQVSGVAAFATNGTGGRGALVARNGTHMPGSGSLVGTVAANPCVAPSGTFPVFLNVGDYVEIDGFQSSTASLATTSSTDLSCSMTVIWVHT